MSQMNLPFQVLLTLASLFLAMVIGTLYASYTYESSVRREYQLTAIVNNALERAIEATRLKDKFVSLVSHDLKGPLGVIKGFMDLSLESAKPEEQTEYARRTQSLATGLLDMISKLLDIGRLQSGRIKPQKLAFNVALLTRELMIRLEPQAEGKNVTLKLDMPEQARLLADRDLTAELIFNLVTNAIKFTPSGGTVTIGLRNSRTLFVADTGTGIHPKILPDIFRHDVKTSMKGTAGETGTGLGLPLCRDIMTAHGGTITASNLENGAEVAAEFPESRPVVLLVDDQEVHRMAMREKIDSFASVDYVEASNGLEAMQVMEEVSPSLIITDISMPEMDGLEFIKKVRQIHTPETLPVIVATSLTESSMGTQEAALNNRTKSLEIGANDFVRKPIEAADFIPRVKRFLR